MSNGTRALLLVALLSGVAALAPSDGSRLVGTYRGPATFFDPAYTRDFITMPASPVPGRR